jgi:hypothetical protein
LSTLPLELNLRSNRCCFPVGISLPILPTAFWQPLTMLSLQRGGEEEFATTSRPIATYLGSRFPRTAAAARWSLTTGGEYYGVGAGVGISGFRANLGAGDDLFGSREDAYSSRRRRTPMVRFRFNSAVAKARSRTVCRSCPAGTIWSASIVHARRF